MSRPLALGDDEGSMLLFLLGAVVLGALLVVVVVDTSTLFLARMRLMSAADGAALAAAQTVDQRVLYTGPDTGALPIDANKVDDAVRRYLAVDGEADVQVVSVSTDGQVARVAFREQVRLPFVDLVTPGAGGGVTVSATAAARSPFLP